MRWLLALCLLIVPVPLAGAQVEPAAARDEPAPAAVLASLLPAQDTLAVRPRVWIAPPRTEPSVAEPTGQNAAGQPAAGATVAASRDRGYSPPDPFDLRVATRVRESGLQRSGTARAIAGVFRLAGLPGTVLLAGALFGAGELADRPDLREMGLRAGQAIVLAGGVTGAGKVAFGRARPHESPDDPYDFRFARGLAGDRYQSFPSAHTAAAFATVAVLSRELAARHEGSGAWIYPSSYAAASLAGISRLFSDDHWATDVLAGALVGAASGWLILEYHDE